MLVGQPVDMMPNFAVRGASHSVALPAGLSWRAAGGFVWLSVVNLGLSLLTLGFYQFWGKAEVRRRIWASVRLLGEPLDYSGTGRELFNGFLIAIVVILLPTLTIPLAAYATFGNSGWQVAQVLLYGAFAYLFGFAVWRAQRYRLSRTSWRGIRLSLDGSGPGYAWASFWTLLLIPLTLGWIVPWRSTMLQKRIVDGMSIGDRRFAFDAVVGPLYLRYLVMWLMTSTIIGIGLATITAYGITYGRSPAMAQGAAALIVVGIILTLMLIYGLTSAWYRAAQFNHFARSTTLGSVRFDGSMTGLGLFWLTLTNWLISVASLGILLPVARSRSAAYMVSHLTISEAESLDGIMQSSADAMASKGEGLANAFDFDAF